MVKVKTVIIVAISVFSALLTLLSTTTGAGEVQGHSEPHEATSSKGLDSLPLPGQDGLVDHVSHRGASAGDVRAALGRGPEAFFLGCAKAVPEVRERQHRVAPNAVEFVLSGAQQSEESGDESGMGAIPLESWVFDFLPTTSQEEDAGADHWRIVLSNPYFSDPKWWGTSGEQYNNSKIEESDLFEGCREYLNAADKIVLTTEVRGDEANLDLSSRKGAFVADRNSKVSIERASYAQLPDRSRGGGRWIFDSDGKGGVSLVGGKGVALPRSRERASGLLNVGEEDRAIGGDAESVLSVHEYARSVGPDHFEALVSVPSAAVEGKREVSEEAQEDQLYTAAVHTSTLLTPMSFALDRSTCTYWSRESVRIPLLVLNRQRRAKKRALDRISGDVDEACGTNSDTTGAPPIGFSSFVAVNHLYTAFEGLREDAELANYKHRPLRRVGWSKRLLLSASPNPGVSQRAQKTSVLVVLVPFYNSAHELWYLEPRLVLHPEAKAREGELSSSHKESSADTPLRHGGEKTAVGRDKGVSNIWKESLPRVESAHALIYSPRFTFINTLPNLFPGAPSRWLAVKPDTTNAQYGSSKSSFIEFTPRRGGGRSSPMLAPHPSGGYSQSPYYRDYYLTYKGLKKEQYKAVVAKWEADQQERGALVTFTTRRGNSRDGGKVSRRIHLGAFPFEGHRHGSELLSSTDYRPAFEPFPLDCRRSRPHHYSSTTLSLPLGEKDWGGDGGGGSTRRRVAPSSHVYGGYMALSTMDLLGRLDLGVEYAAVGDALLPPPVNDREKMRRGGHGGGGGGRDGLLPSAGFVDTDALSQRRMTACRKPLPRQASPSSSGRAEESSKEDSVNSPAFPSPEACLYSPDFLKNKVIYFIGDSHMRILFYGFLSRMGVSYPLNKVWRGDRTDIIPAPHNVTVHYIASYFLNLSRPSALDMLQKSQRRGGQGSHEEKREKKAEGLSMMGDDTIIVANVGQHHSAHCWPLRKHSAFVREAMLTLLYGVVVEDSHDDSKKHVVLPKSLTALHRMPPLPEQAPLRMSSLNNLHHHEAEWYSPRKFPKEAVQKSSESSAIHHPPPAEQPSSPRLMRNLIWVSIPAQPINRHLYVPKPVGQSRRDCRNNQRHSLMNQEQWRVWESVLDSSTSSASHHTTMPHSETALPRRDASIGGVRGAHFVDAFSLSYGMAHTSLDGAHYFGFVRAEWIDEVVRGMRSVFTY